jgi:hypothetical protein
MAHLKVSPRFLEFLKNEAVRLAKLEGNWARIPLWRVCDELMRELIDRRATQSGSMLKPDRYSL